MITLRNAEVKLFDDGGICWMSIKRDEQDYETLKEIGRGTNLSCNSYFGIQRAEYKGNTIYLQ